MPAPPFSVSVPGPSRAELASGAATFATTTRRLRIGRRSGILGHPSFHVCGRSRAIFTPLLLLPFPFGRPATTSLASPPIIKLPVPTAAEHGPCS